MDEALVQFGRDNTFDVPSLVNTLLHKGETVNDMIYAFKWVFAHMLRKKAKAPFSDTDLTGSGGVLAQCHWARRYKHYLLHNYPEVVREPPVTEKVGADAAASAAVPINMRAVAKSCMLDPMVLYTTLDGPKRSPTLLTALPSDALRMMLAHVSEIDRGIYSPEVKGALTSQLASNRYDPEKFLAAERPKKLSVADFSIAYKASTLKQGGALQEDPQEQHLNDAVPSTGIAPDVRRAVS